MGKPWGVWNRKVEFIYTLQNIQENSSLRLALFTTAPLALDSAVGKEEEKGGIRNFKRNYYKIVCSILCNRKSTQVSFNLNGSKKFSVCKASDYNQCISIFQWYKTWFLEMI